MSKREYDYCAKGGHRVDDLLPGHYVCDSHHGTSGWFTHCAVCGLDFGTKTRCWVCEECLADTPTAGVINVRIHGFHIGYEAVPWIERILQSAMRASGRDEAGVQSVRVESVRPVIGGTS